ncbi:thioesterase domain-containing protein [Shewanella sp. AS1]|uniref:thioesterase domain-containing protein n=1 Tax=Shewanella sp. AS1 TaxID=2907626 RepID=UPI001F2CC6BC|nr:thioesterase domain-containing protein [Shewanella sp. AS1]MCE9680613.1 thioesterase domain-containing protein [Shewanella sp. AS1]
MSQAITELLSELKQTWHSTIPVSEFMQICPESYLDNQFFVTAPLAPNINLHQTMFAGSIYTLMTLTGWGAVWINQRLSRVEGDIVLAKADIRYLAPVTGSPVAKVDWPRVDMKALAQGQRVKVALTVKLYCEDSCCAEFEGTYVSLPVG